MSRVIEADLHRVLRRRGEVRFADAPVLATRGTRRAERRAYREALAARIQEAIGSGEIKNKAEAARVLGVSRVLVARVRIDMRDPYAEPTKQSSETPRAAWTCERSGSSVHSRAPRPRG
jgi:hypothetical protein